MNLDNIMFIIIFLLLIVILGFLYYMSNNIKKNQNKINILESDVHALRERLGVQNEKMNSIDTYLNKDMMDKKNNSKDNSDPVDFSNFLERISAMNGNMMNDDDEEYSEEDSSTENDSSVEDMSNESSSEDEEDGSDVYETEEESASEEVSIDDNVKSVSSEPEPEPEPEPVPEPVQEPVKEVEVPKKEEESAIGLDDLMDDKSSKKMPTASIKKLDLGTVMLGGDGKTKYVVALNKSGKKYWKRN